MNSPFRPDELITKNGKAYPVVGARLRVAHEDNTDLSISTELISFEALDQAVVKATAGTEKGTYLSIALRWPFLISLSCMLIRFKKPH